MQTLALVWGICAAIGMVIGFFPCLGALNWLNIPFAIVGLVISLIAMNQATPEKKGTATTAVVLCAISVVVGSVRLLLGGGVL